MDNIILTKPQLTHILRWYFYISNKIFPPIPPSSRTRSSAPRWRLSPGTRWSRVGKDWENATHLQSVMMTVMTGPMRGRDGEYVWHKLLSYDSVTCLVSVPLFHPYNPEWYKRKLPSLSSDCTNTIVCSVLSCDSSIVDLMTTCMMTLFIYRVQREQLAIYYCIEHALVSSHTLHSALLQLHFPSSSSYSADD